jgi:tripeptidyl-peptidase-1
VRSPSRFAEYDTLTALARRFMAPQRAKAEVELLGRRASRSNVTRSARGDDCTQQMTPACFQSLYGLPTTRSTQEKNGVIVSAYGGQSANMNDLSAFMSEYRPDMAKTGGVVFKTVSMDGGSNSQADGGAGAEAVCGLCVTDEDSTEREL